MYMLGCFCFPLLKMSEIGCLVILWLALWRSVFLQTPTVVHLVNEFPGFYGTGSFITILKQHPTGPYSESDESSRHFKSISSQFILILSSHTQSSECMWKLSPITYLLTYGAEPFFRSCQLCSCSRTSQHFMEPEGSWLCLQEPSTGPCPEPDQYRPYHPVLSL
jgi:hypothetical protein